LTENFAPLFTFAHSSRRICDESTDNPIRLEIRIDKV